MRLVQEQERPAYLIVDQIKNRMLERRELVLRSKELGKELDDINRRVNTLEDEKRLLETNLSRALIQEIEGEDRATI